MQPEDRNWFHLRQIVRMVALIENRLMTFDKPAFLADRN